MGRPPRLPARLALLAGLLASAASAQPAAGGDPRERDPWFREGQEAVARARALAPGAGRARNAVLFLGDGMGLSTVTAARILEGQLRQQPGEENQLAFETLPHVALLKTYNTNQQVPDSAGSMTAIMSGLKTKAGLIGLAAGAEIGDPAGLAARVPTLLEEAEAHGLATGVVTTTSLTHATPAACYAHVPHRDWQDDASLPAAARAAGVRDIALQLVEPERGDGLEVALGGGRAHFLPSSVVDPEDPDQRGLRLDGRNLVTEWRRRHPDGAWLWNRAQLLAVDAARTPRVLGLFDPSHMEFEMDRAADAAGEPSLAEMTALALRILSRDGDGFFLMVEGGRIDHAHHAGSAARALRDTIAFSDAVRMALEQTDPAETLVVVTADHGHVMHMGGYPTRGNPILGLVVQNDASGRPGGPALDAEGRPYTTLSYANGPGHLAATDGQPAGPKHHPHVLTRSEGAVAGRPVLTPEQAEAPDYLPEAAVPRFMETHSGEDVPLYAGGPGAALFHGVQEQNFVYHAMREALGWDAPRPSADPARPGDSASESSE